ncbi:MAG: U32 family peptidase C-terminal domain-containing protein [Candidatus Moranbacteria bacterium]|nr:U32 family peptidase C-terminal domain-containing protein [Candidatus Moranbacteria bacterium]
MKKIELLAPAGDLEKLKYALAFGADAVYCGVPDFSLRVRINRFSNADLKKAVEYVHARKKKIYVTLNIYAHNQHLEKIKAHIQFLKKLKVDAIIASDPGIILLIQKHWPECEIHLSTQANATNFSAVEFWKKQGVKRIILAREVSLSEIKEIRKKTKNIELEYFVHGAMCMSYSGRCILSKWMTDRSANLGDCSQPCRWGFSTNYESNTNIRMSEGEECKKITVVDDQKRYGMDVEEDSHGTYFLNSYDMNLLAHLLELRDAGVESFKIEGRAKSAYYLAIVTRAYRKVIDAVETHCNASLQKKIISEQKAELDNLVHRGYSTGFLLGREPEHNFSNINNPAKFQFVGEVKSAEGKLNILRVHNHISKNDKLEVITPKENIKLKIKKILDNNKNEVMVADGGHDKEYYFEFDKKLESGSLVRKVV